MSGILSEQVDSPPAGREPEIPQETGDSSGSGDHNALLASMGLSSEEAPAAPSPAPPPPQPQQQEELQQPPAQPPAQQQPAQQQQPPEQQSQSQDSGETGAERTKRMARESWKNRADNRNQMRQKIESLEAEKEAKKEQADWMAQAIAKAAELVSPKQDAAPEEPKDPEQIFAEENQKIEDRFKTIQDRLDEREKKEKEADEAQAQFQQNLAMKQQDVSEWERYNPGFIGENGVYNAWYATKIQNHMELGATRQEAAALVSNEIELLWQLAPRRELHPCELIEHQAWQMFGGEQQPQQQASQTQAPQAQQQTPASQTLAASAAARQERVEGMGTVGTGGNAPRTVQDMIDAGISADQFVEALAKSEDRDLVETLAQMDQGFST